MRGRSRESELVETPPHRAELWSSAMPCRPLPARGARNAVRRAGYFPDGGATSASGWLLRLSASATKPEAFISSTNPRR
jgi:hypothetical protein